MIHKLSALGFLALMTLVLAFQQPVFGYCACHDHLFFAECECPAPEQKQPSCGEHCCEEEETPDDDCCKKISYDLDEILWSGTAEPPEPTELKIVPAPLQVAPGLLPAFQIFGASTRPRPPPDGDQLALFLRLGVMRL